MKLWNNDNSWRVRWVELGWLGWVAYSAELGWILILANILLIFIAFNKDSFKRRRKQNIATFHYYFAPKKMPPATQWLIMGSALCHSTAVHSFLKTFGSYFTSWWSILEECWHHSEVIDHCRPTWSIMACIVLGSEGDSTRLGSSQLGLGQVLKHWLKVGW